MKKLLALLVCTVSLTACITHSTGEKVGIVTKTTRAGVICHSNEIELVRGGLTNGTGVMGAPFDATVSDENLAILTAAMEQQKEVKVKYHMEMFTFCRSHNENSAFIDSVEVK